MGTKQLVIILAIVFITLFTGAYVYAVKKENDKTPTKGKELVVRYDIAEREVTSVTNENGEPASIVDPKKFRQIISVITTAVAFTESSPGCAEYYYRNRTVEVCN